MLIKKSDLSQVCQDLNLERVPAYSNKQTIIHDL